MALRVLYIANHGNIGSDDTEGHITRSLTKLGCEVTTLHERDAKTAPELETDLVLFHKWYDLDTLNKIKAPKAFWYFDKIDWNDRPKWFAQVVPLVDIGFLTDRTWLNANPNHKLHVLRQGIGYDNDLRGQKDVRYAAQVGFTGSVYGGREEFVDLLKTTYGRDFKVFNQHFNRALYNVCASVPVIVAPRYPSDDHYWSSRVYMVLGSGGFLLHPRCRELELEYSSDELVMYEGYPDLVDKIDYYLKHPEERIIIQEAGYQKTITSYSYTERCRSLLQEIQLRGIIGTKG